MSGGSFHLGDNYNVFGHHNIGQAVFPEPAEAPAPAWTMSGRPDQDPVPSEPLVFVNYRRTDVKAATDVEQEFRRRLGSAAVFLDARMPAGTEFPRELMDKASRCRVMIVIIGERWDDRGGLRLLRNGTDWVRREIATALAHRAQVVPVLVGARRRLVSSALPEDIRKIADLQGPHLRDGYDDRDVRGIVDELLREVPALAEAAFRRR